MMSPGKFIVVSPIGEYEDGCIQAVMREVERLFGFPGKVIPILDDVEFAYNEKRDQYHSTVILEKLTDSAPSGALKVIGLTQVDLFIPILTYVFGEAQLGGTSCIVSSYRLGQVLSPAGLESVFDSRILKEAIHELGHTFKLRHCPEKTCIMHYCRSVDDVDQKSGQFCRYCRVLIEDEKKRLGF